MYILSIVKRPNLTSKQYLAYWLSQRERTAYECRKKLKLKEYSHEDIESSLEWAMDIGLLDDSRFVAKFLYGTAARKNYSRLQAVTKLKSKGINENIIAENWQFTEEAEIIKIRNLLNKKLKAPSPKTEELTKAKVSLRRKGFKISEINEAIRASGFRTPSSSQFRYS